MSEPEFDNPFSEQTEEACDSCMFYEPSDSDHSHGVCRRHAPIPVVNSDPDEEPNLYAHWPLVRAVDWCGEWESAEFEDEFEAEDEDE